MVDDSVVFFLYSNHQVANLSASLRQEKEKIKVEMESSLHALNVVMKANQFISLDLVFKYTLLFRSKERSISIFSSVFL